MTFRKIFQAKTKRKAKSELSNLMSMIIRAPMTGNKIASLKKISSTTLIWYTRDLFRLLQVFTIVILILTRKLLT